ncbi:uncharacterized protein LOC128501626 [Spea bombifrons]|uniref:uncharacterized protein LOC128501626 n=1 Tax=Spea bombifrons TaxID=233779 RepID=UPI00234959D9|nr:uncharacterized protein LOC128501626 [Spea bombifrons]
MDVLEQFLSGDEEKLNASELENILQLLSDDVQAKRELLEENKATMLDLEAEIKERSLERDSLVALMAQTVDLDGLLVKEAETNEKLHAASLELEKIKEPSHSDPSKVSGDSRLEKLDADTDKAIAALIQKEKQLLGQKEHLLKLMEIAQRDEQRAKEELSDALRASSARVSGSGTQRSEADILLDTCIKEMGLLDIVPNVKHERKNKH